MSIITSAGVALLTLLLGCVLGVAWADRRTRAANRQEPDMLVSLQDELTNAERALHSVTEELDQFAYIASHDLRAPLRAVANLAGFLKEDVAGQIPEESQKHLEMIIQRVARLDGLILGLLTYSRVSRHDETGVMSDIDLLVEKSFNEHTSARTTLRYQPSQLRFPLAPKRFVASLGLVFANAEVHHDQEAIELQVRADQQADRLLVTITDDGPGIEPRYHDRVFELFSTLRSRDQVESSGMGLAILAKTMRQIGGSVTLNSDPSIERGASFVLEWPAESISIE